MSSICQKVYYWDCQDNNGLVAEIDEDGSIFVSAALLSRDMPRGAVLDAGVGNVPSDTQFKDSFLNERNKEPIHTWTCGNVMVDPSDRQHVLHFRQWLAAVTAMLDAAVESSKLDEELRGTM